MIESSSHKDTHVFEFIRIDSNTKIRKEVNTSFAYLCVRIHTYSCMYTCLIYVLFQHDNSKQ